MPLKPSELANVPFVSVENMMAMIGEIGLETALVQLADEI